MGTTMSMGTYVGSSVLPGPTASPRTLQPQHCATHQTPEYTWAHLIFWRALSPVDVLAFHVSWDNPNGNVTNSDLELADRMIHCNFMADFITFGREPPLPRLTTPQNYVGSGKGLTLPLHHFPIYSDRAPSNSGFTATSLATNFWAVWTMSFTITRIDTETSLTAHSSPTWNQHAPRGWPSDCGTCEAH